MTGESSDELWRDVVDEAGRLAYPLPDGAAQRLASFLDLIARWNRKVRIVGRADPESLVRVHLSDSLALAKALRHHPSYGEVPGQIVDVGTGAGLPGFALGLLIPSLRVSLCEISEKRLAFLHEAKRQVGLEVEILEMRVQELALSPRRFGHAVSRATFAAEEWRRLGEPLLAPRGLLWSLWSREQAEPFQGDDLYRLHYTLRDGRERVISARQAL